MNLQKTAVASILTLSGLFGCGSQPIQPTVPLAFNYKTDNAIATGIVQVFELNGNTVVQLRDIASKPVAIFDANNAEIGYTVFGQNVVLPGVHAAFRVVSGAATSTVAKVDGTGSQPGDDGLRQNAMIASTNPAKQTRYEDMDDNQMRLEVARISREIAAVKKLLAGAKGSDDTVRTAQVEPAVKSEWGPTETIRVSFRNNSDVFEPTPEMRDLIINSAKRASLVSVRGYTDSPIPNPSAAALAKSRAISARNFLMTHGVSAQKISLGFEPAGKFVANNKTKDGKEANRRVEIKIS